MDGADPTEPAEVVDREAARVLVVDGDGLLLLVEGCDPAAPERGRWWFTPGGGLDPGEDARAGAARELWEETGIADVDLVGPVAERTAEFDYDGVLYRQHEVFFVARVEAGRRVVPGGLTDLERRALSGHRWWSAADLTATTDVHHPDWLADWLASWSADRVVGRVVDPVVDRVVGPRTDRP